MIRFDDYISKNGKIETKSVWWVVLLCNTGKGSLTRIELTPDIDKYLSISTDYSTESNAFKPAIIIEVGEHEKALEFEESFTTNLNNKQIRGIFSRATSALLQAYLKQYNSFIDKNVIFQTPLAEGLIRLDKRDIDKIVSHCTT